MPDHRVVLGLGESPIVIRRRQLDDYTCGEYLMQCSTIGTGRASCECVRL